MLYACEPPSDEILVVDDYSELPTHPTPLARLQFALLVLLLIAHRLVNREWMGALGLVEGALQAWRKHTS